ncbi:hypothetical protein BCR33DRAFT_579555 [Rhizoclosmatium globosum]|uniref:Uncharacterized protein n=1 Tax=Rhizoclosmatium globosum TaxID=329046 RepID=A0A1Y2CQK6_9FUNG|nr:hypothetical protein BCR33DRAFT_579555 [Rhizoclosmatium globosum]|eukprot:ORY49312.1 hypothetical protein BCR33DRAFT_579555 [Rhizoclosmatium globosum]
MFTFESIPSTGLVRVSHQPDAVPSTYHIQSDTEAIAALINNDSFSGILPEEGSTSTTNQLSALTTKEKNDILLPMNGASVSESLIAPMNVNLSTSNLLEELSAFDAAAYVCTEPVRSSPTTPKIELKVLEKLMDGLTIQLEADGTVESVGHIDSLLDGYMDSVPSSVTEKCFEFTNLPEDSMDSASVTPGKKRQQAAMLPHAHNITDGIDGSKKELSIIVETYNQNLEPLEPRNVPIDVPNSVIEPNNLCLFAEDSELSLMSQFNSFDEQSFVKPLEAISDSTTVSSESKDALSPVKKMSEIVPTLFPITPVPLTIVESVSSDVKSNSILISPDKDLKSTPLSFNDSANVFWPENELRSTDELSKSSQHAPEVPVVEKTPTSAQNPVEIIISKEDYFPAHIMRKVWNQK